MLPFAHLKSRIANLESLAESVSGQLAAWARFLQNTDIKGQGHLAERSKEVYAQQKRVGIPGKTKTEHEAHRERLRKEREAQRTRVHVTEGVSVYLEDDLLPLSALQHVMFCERQCALVYLEQCWDENRLTAEGRLLHERVHGADDESRGDVRIVRGLRLRSLQQGLVGQADVVEFHRQPDGSWVPFPVEYKRGRPKPDVSDEVQLCGQALCLEEMLGISVPEGAIYYGQPRRRHPVVFGADLRHATERAAERVRELLKAGVTPPAIYEKKCQQCSLLDHCMPKIAGERKSAKRYLGAMLAR